VLVDQIRLWGRVHAERKQAPIFVHDGVRMLPHHRRECGFARRISFERGPLAAISSSSIGSTTRFDQKARHRTDDCYLPRTRTSIVVSPRARRDGTWPGGGRAAGPTQSALWRDRDLPVHVGVDHATRSCRRRPFVTLILALEGSGPPSARMPEFSTRCRGCSP